MNVPQWQNNPPQFPSRQGRDPRTPFGSPAPDPLNTPTQIEAYQQPRGGAARSILIGVVALAVVAAVLLWLQFGPNQDGATGGPSSVVPSANASSLGAQESQAPFEANGGGTFELLSHNWTSDNEVEVQVRITLNEGSASFDIYLLSSRTMKSYSPVNSPSLRAGAGRPLETTLKFEAPRDRSTVILSTESGRGRGLAALTLNP